MNESTEAKIKVRAELLSDDPTAAGEAIGAMLLAINPEAATAYANQLLEVYPSTPQPTNLLDDNTVDSDLDYLTCPLVRRWERKAARELAEILFMVTASEFDTPADLAARLHNASVELHKLMYRPDKVISPEPSYDTF